MVDERLRSNAKNGVYTSLFVTIYLLWGQGQRSISNGKVKCLACSVDIRGKAFQEQQKAIILKVEANDYH